MTSCGGYPQSFKDLVKAVMVSGAIVAAIVGLFSIDFGSKSIIEHLTPEKEKPGHPKRNPPSKWTATPNLNRMRWIANQRQKQIVIRATSATLALPSVLLTATCNAPAGVRLKQSGDPSGAPFTVANLTWARTDNGERLKV